jgi:tryptophanyl-tRNA synthetase
VLRKKIMGMVTDSAAVEDPKDPDTSSIVALYRLVASPEEVRQMEHDFREGGFGYGDFKKRLFGALWERFAPFRERRAELAAQADGVEAVLAEGAKRAREVAEKTMTRVRSAFGLR